MDTASPPPLPPPVPPVPPSQAPKTRPTPQPQPAAIPYNGYPPIQETNPSPEALNDAQGEEVLLPVQVQEGQEDSEDSEDKYHPVQETDPAPEALNHPQMAEQQDEQATQTDPSGEGQMA
ncbi:proline-, glutamic acid- and leucine-rich protein 1-like [Lates japonicus]|uniref:Proline-, glutamic acid- and leucine-rich protein 1-like protein n=1 Tax=Lates japonicus TaxID=270547 RepID=A0AAD3RF40_LATJO|nr:proline-, glutamic acid- and leucine-rich protein 1-like protein [Lates japonicus]